MLPYSAKRKNWPKTIYGGNGLFGLFFSDHSPLWEAKVGTQAEQEVRTET